MTTAQENAFLLEIIRLIHEADAALLGQSSRPSGGVTSMIMGHHRDAVMLARRILEPRGVQHV
jgi:hypothetical protein